MECWKISRWSVTGENGKLGESLVGVIVKEDKIILIHTRNLTEEDIIHELCHASDRKLTEEEVIQKTEELINIRKTRHIIRENML